MLLKHVSSLTLRLGSCPKEISSTVQMNDKAAALQSRYFYEGGKQGLNEAWSIENDAHRFRLRNLSDISMHLLSITTFSIQYSLIPPKSQTTKQDICT